MDFLTIILILLAVALGYFVGSKISAIRRDKYWENEIPNHRKDAIMKSRATLGGLFSEQLAPYLPDFPYSPTEVRFLGKPIDFVVFKGMDGKKIDEVVFVEVKSGKAQLSKVEKSLKLAIENKNVGWHEYKVPEEMTKNKQ